MNTPYENTVSENLVQDISKMLKDNGHKEPNLWETYLHPDAFTTKDIELQRFFINRAWVLILGSLDTVDTTEVRSFLVSQSTISQYLDLFKRGVLPCILRHNLPPIPR